MGICALCLQSRELKEQSHLMPKFVGRWLKDTSATGRLRNAMDANVPRQDLPKKPFLCEECEDRFEKFETAFSKNVFRPYVYEELDAQGLKTYTLNSIEYEEWLLKFAMSVLWRHLAWEQVIDEGMRPEQIGMLATFQEDARKYLLELSSQPQGCETHVLFIQSIRSHSDPLPEQVHERAETYLLRSVDPTVVWNADALGVFVKLGVVGVYTSLLPLPMAEMKGTLVGIRGRLSIRQEFGPFISRFLLIDRPAQTYKSYNVSVAQQQAIEERVRKDLNRSHSSMSLAADRGNEHIKMLKQMGKSSE